MVSRATLVGMSIGTGVSHTCARHPKGFLGEVLWMFRNLQDGWAAWNGENRVLGVILLGSPDLTSKRSPRPLCASTGKVPQNEVLWKVTYTPRT